MASYLVAIGNLLNSDFENDAAATPLGGLGQTDAFYLFHPAAASETVLSNASIRRFRVELQIESLRNARPVTLRIALNSKERL